MKNFENIDEILDFAIESEQDAIDFYSELSEKATTDDMKLVFEDFVKEEIKHKSKLIEIKKNGLFNLSSEKITDLKIADYLVSVKSDMVLTYEDALILGMKKEKAAFKLYTTLAERAPNKELKSIFELLAQEESKHKLRFELEYDDHILRDN